MPHADETKSGLASNNPLSALGPDVVRALSDAVREAVSRTVPAAVDEAVPTAVSDAVPAAFDRDLPRAADDAVPPAVDNAVPAAIEAELNAVPVLSPARFEALMGVQSADLAREVRDSHAPLVTQLEQLGIDAPVTQLRTELRDLGAPVDRLLPMAEGSSAAGSFVPAPQA